MTSVFWVPAEERCGPDGVAMDKSLLQTTRTTTKPLLFFLSSATKKKSNGLPVSSHPVGKNLAILDVGCAEGELSVLLAPAGAQGNRPQTSLLRFSIKPKSARPKTASWFPQCFLTWKSSPAPNWRTRSTLSTSWNVYRTICACPAQGLVTLRAMLHEKGTLVIHTLTWLAGARIIPVCQVREKGRRTTFRPESRDLHLQGYDYQTLRKGAQFLPV